MPQKGFAMKTWIRRSLIGLATVSVVAGLAACGHGPMGSAGPEAGMGSGMGPGMGMMRHHRGPMTEADAAKFRDRMVERATQELALDDAQKKKLVTLMDKMHQQRLAMAGPAGKDGVRPNPREQFQGLIAGEKFDRNKAQALVDEKTATLKSAGPELITAAGDFYDSLKPEQQAKVRDFLNKGPGRGMGRGWRHG
jgi:Spy/CpxP family protein refolding chaperone